MRRDGKRVLDLVRRELVGAEDLGLSLCRRHHWAFDAGLFTVTEGRAVRVSPAVQRAQRQRFDLEEYDGERLVGASDECFLPAPEALAWHRDHRFRAA